MHDSCCKDVPTSPSLAKLLKTEAAAASCRQQQQQHFDSGGGDSWGSISKMLHQRYNTGGAAEATGKDLSIITYRDRVGERIAGIPLLRRERVCWFPRDIISQTIINWTTCAGRTVAWSGSARTWARPLRRGNGASRRRRPNKGRPTACWWTCWWADAMWVPVTCVSRRRNRKTVGLRPLPRSLRRSVPRVFITTTISLSTPPHSGIALWRPSDARNLYPVKRLDANFRYINYTCLLFSIRARACRPPIHSYPLVRAP